MRCPLLSHLHCTGKLYCGIIKPNMHEHSPLVQDERHTLYMQMTNRENLDPHYIPLHYNMIIMNNYSSSNNLHLHEKKTVIDFIEELILVFMAYLTLEHLCAANVDVSRDYFKERGHVKLTFYSVE